MTHLAVDTSCDSSSNSCMHCHIDYRTLLSLAICTIQYFHVILNNLLSLSLCTELFRTLYNLLKVVRWTLRKAVKFNSLLSYLNDALQSFCLNTFLYMWISFGSLSCFSSPRGNTFLWRYNAEVLSVSVITSFCFMTVLLCQTIEDIWQ